MSSAAENAHSTLDAIADEAQRSLRGRPSFSIRTRLVIGFLLWIVLSLGITLASILTTSLIQSKLIFLEIQQARRFEKNYFLYETGLDDALEHVQNANEILLRERENIVGVIGTQQHNEMIHHVDRYEYLLGSLRDGETSPERGDIEAEVREHGAQMVMVADELLAKERRVVNSMLTVSRCIPLGFLLLLILLIVYFALIMARQVFAPLNRMMRVLRRIADGDLTPAMPQKGYRDEFSQLAMAMNHMMVQLNRRHEMLAQAQKLKAVGTLTAGVAHELNNPINNIVLTADAIRDDYADLSDDERREMADDLVSQSERAQRIVRNLLEFAREDRISAGAHEVEEIIESTLRLAANQIKLSNVRIKGELSSNLSPIYGDKQQLEQVFLNLVLNALDAMPDGGTLTISCETTRDREHVCVKFADSGVGIPEHMLPDVFNPFFTTKPGTKGTGLGLAVSLAIVRQHGGDMRVESEVGVGTTFSVLLPVVKVPADVIDENRDIE
jgi:two-component system NtrC family sensor kinase